MEAKSKNDHKNDHKSDADGAQPRSNVTSIGITGGIPNSGSGNVSTLDNLIGLAGSPSPQVQSMQGVTGGVPVPANMLIGGTAPDKGPGAGGANTTRVTIDSAQVGSLGPQTAANSVSVTPDTGTGFPMTPVDQYANYNTVAASTTLALSGGGGGASGDYLAGLLIVPGTPAAGAVTIKDGAGAAITIFAGGGTTALTSLVPFMVPIGAFSKAGAWSVITLANVTAIAVGKFH